MINLVQITETGTVEETSWQPEAIGSREGVGVMESALKMEAPTETGGVD